MKMVVGYRQNHNNLNTRMASVDYYTYTYDGAAWTMHSQNLLLVSSCHRSFCGRQLTMSGDGSTMVIGEARKNGDKGRILLYKWDPSTSIWNYEGDEFASDRFGVSVDLSRDGSMLIAGTQRGGYARIYSISSTHQFVFLQQVQGGPTFGNSVAISADKSSVAVGEYKHQDSILGQGAVFYYRYDGSSFQLKHTLHGPASKNNFYGGSVALSEDGKGLVIGVLRDGIGRLGEFIWKYYDDSTDTFSNDKVVSGTGDGNVFGNHVAMSSDGGTVGGVGAGFRMMAYERSGDPLLSTFSHLKTDEPGINGVNQAIAISGDGNTIIYGYSDSDYLAGSLNIIQLAALSTPSPTTTPTSSPTPSPTTTPTSSPTPSPTTNPTTSPTPSPSSPPSESPSTEPSTAPSESPSTEPSASPTIDPWKIENAVVTADPNAALILVSHDIYNSPASARVVVYEDDCATPLPSKFVSLTNDTTVVGFDEVKYSFFIDMNEASSSPIFTRDGPTSGSFSFCSDVITESSSGEGVSFSRTKYNVDVDFATFSFVVTTALDEVDEVDVQMVFTVTACECNATYHCTNTVHQQSSTAPILQICLFPGNANQVISNLDLDLTSSVSGFIYHPVSLGTNGYNTDELTFVSESNNALKITTRIVDNLFDGGNSLTVSGTAVFGSGNKQDESCDVNLVIEIEDDDEVAKSGCFEKLLGRVLRFF